MCSTWIQKLILRWNTLFEAQVKHTVTLREIVKRELQELNSFSVHVITFHNDILLQIFVEDHHTWMCFCHQFISKWCIVCILFHMTDTPNDIPIRYECAGAFICSVYIAILMNSRATFNHIYQVCFIGIGSIEWLTQCQRRNHENVDRFINWPSVSDVTMKNVDRFMNTCCHNARGLLRIAHQKSIPKA